MAETNDTEELKTTKSSGPKAFLVPIILVVNIVMLGAMLFFQYSSLKKMEERDSVRELVALGESSQSGDALQEKEMGGLLYPLDNFTVNLAQGDGPRRFVRINLVLKFDTTSKEEEFTIRTPQIRDAIISILNTKRPEDLLKKEGKVYLKEEIKSSINSFFVDGKVNDVYYVNFQIN